MRIGSLFSGIGGLELGLEWSGLGETVWQVEQSAWCRERLARHWPNAERFDDVREVGYKNLAAVDLICGGFPCQDVSSAGLREGLTGKRSGLWFEFARIVGELRPRWVVVENVASGAENWVDAVLAGLEEQGYHGLPFPVSGGDVGAPYPRARVFIVAHTDRYGEHLLPLNAEVGRAPGAGCVASGARQAPDADSLQLRNEPRGRGGSHREGTKEHFRHFGWATFPSVDAVVPGFPGRVDHQRALGNAVVPQCAEVIGHLIQELRR